MTWNAAPSGGDAARACADPLFVRLLLLLLAAYAGIYGWMLAAGHFIPYVMDNNESFSTLVHAYNLVHFDFWRSYGLADEAASPHAAAHPVLHTHQGNFPRLFGTLIYLLGATTIEAQIAVTTFSIGVLGVVFAYIFFARRSGASFAFVLVLVLITDYVLFAQWQIVTYRVWHVFFLFSSLLCVEGIGGCRPARWAALTAVNFLCLFYWEFVYVAFVSLTTGLYALWLYRRRWTRLFAAWAAQGMGALAGLAILAIQLIAYMGWSDFLTDARYTFLARNFAEGKAFETELSQFYNGRNIAFFYNIAESAKYAGVSNFFSSLFKYLFQVHTPLLTLIVLVLVGAAALGAVVGIGTSRLGKKRPAGALLIAIVLFPGIYLFALLLLRDQGFLGFRSEGYDELPTIVALESGALLVLTCAVALTLSYLVHRPLFGATPPTLSQALVAAGLLLGASMLVAIQGWHYDQWQAPLWFEELLPYGRGCAALLVAVTATLAVLLVLSGPQRMLGEGGVAVCRIAPFLVTGAAAYVLIYLLSPGYLHTGYLERFAPFLVFHVDALFGLAFYLLLAIARHSWRRWSLHRDAPRAMRGRRGAAGFAVATGAMAVGLALACAAAWSYQQVQYTRLLPPTGYAFAGLLTKPPLRGASFAANNYALPVASLTGEWAFLDPKLAEGRVHLTDHGWRVERDFRYLWMADRENPAYLRPEYFLCLITRSLKTVTAELRGEDESRCRNVGIVRRALHSEHESLRHRLVARDDAGDHWAILKLDWDFPPYLRPRSSGRFVEARANLTTEQIAIAYEYAQQSGEPERGTIYRLYRLGGKLAPCSASDTGVVLIAETENSAGLHLPASPEGGIFQVSVTPRSASGKAGIEYFSAPLTLGDSDGGCRR